MKKQGNRHLSTESKRERILEAALACIERFGVAKTTLDDVTEASGLGRMTVYRIFRTRSDLLNALAVKRLQELADKLRPIVNSFDSFEEAVIHGSIKSTEFTKDDQILFSLIENTSDKSIERLLIDPGTPVDDLMTRVWSGVFGKARKKKILRKDLSNKELINWLRAIHLILHLRDDLDTKGRKKFIKNFTLPSMIDRER